jgi:hypothetical protein
MKKELILSMCLFAALLHAQPCDVRGDFRETSSTSPARGWDLGRQPVFLPLPKYEREILDGKVVLTFTDITARDGFTCNSYVKIPAKAGDVIRVTARVKGVGGAWFALHLYNAKQAWIGGLPRQARPLAPEWQTLTVDLPVANPPKGKEPAAAVSLSFGAPRDADLSICNLQVVRVAKPAAPAVPPAK